MPTVDLVTHVVVTAAEAHVLLQGRLVAYALGSVALLVVGPATLHLDLDFACCNKREVIKPVALSLPLPLTCDVIMVPDNEAVHRFVWVQLLAFLHCRGALLVPSGRALLFVDLFAFQRLLHNHRPIAGANSYHCGSYRGRHRLGS